MVCGVLLLDKPEGLSSNAALQTARRLVGAAKAGHVGSLDPLATGMLPLCFGEATKLAGEILGGRKCYRFTVALGTATATGDREGAPIETLSVPVLDPDQLQAVLGRFRGRQQQVPPMYSALKHHGQPLYRLARAGVAVERAARDIDIAELTLCEARADAVELEALCSTGTYIRTLGEDIARALGTCGHVSRLRRRYVEPFVDAPLTSLPELEALCRGGHAPPLMRADAALPALPAVSLPGGEAERLAHGQRVALPECRASGRLKLYDERGRFMGLGEGDGQGNVWPRRLFVQPLESP
jgi:tRNA pseudouridine55 synthase